MNSKQNAFLSSALLPKTDKIFLNTLGDLSRDMYHPRTPIPVTEYHAERDTVVHKKNTVEKDRERLVIDLMSEIKSLKQKMTFVIEKDQEIYRLKCENEHLKNEVSEYKQTTVTDETLQISNDSLTQEVSELQEENQMLKDENLKIKKILIQYHTKLVQSPQDPVYTMNQKLQLISDYINTKKRLPLVGLEPTTFDS